MARQDVNLRLESRPGDVDDGDIYSVERGPAHDTCYSHLFSNSCCKSCRICKASTGRNSLISNERIRSASPWFKGSKSLICSGVSEPPGFNSSLTECSLTS